MNFLTLTLKAFLGACAALTVYCLFAVFVIFGYHPLILLIVGVICLLKAIFFAPLYAAVHLKRTPTLRSSLLTAIGFDIAAAAVRFIMDPNYDGLVLLSIIEVVSMALVLGGGAFLASRIGSKKPAP